MPAPAPARREPERQAAPAESTRPSAAQVAAESAAAARADEAGVQQVITQYLQAFDRRDAGAVKRLFPGADTRALEERSITNWSARLVQPPTVTVRGTAAEAAFSYALSFFHADMGTQRSTLAAHATLQKVGDGWRIQRLDATPR
jgi:hypothetical protein